MKQFVAWLGQTSLSVWLRQAPYPYPGLIIIHILTIALFGGVVVMGNLRVLGLVMRSMPVSRVLGQFRPWKWAAFTILLVTGILLTLSDPMEYYTNIMYWFSLLVILGTGVNAMVFHLGVYQTVSDWDEATLAPASARAWAIRSLILWVSLVFIGRAIAFF